jgi:hypothetical protein
LPIELKVLQTMKPEERKNLTAIAPPKLQWVGRWRSLCYTCNLEVELLS